MRAAVKPLIPCVSRASCVGLQAQPHRAFATDLSARPDPDTFVPASFDGGRAAVSGITCTVFGAYGFVGRYVVNRLGRVGSQVVIPYRGDGMKTRHLKVMGDLGQIVHLPMDLTDEDSIRRSVEKSNVVINLVGNVHKTKNYSYDDTNVKCVHRIAKICHEVADVKRFIHVSALGADVNSKSEFLRSKARGEEVVRDFFPKSTILRPAPIFGHEDWFLNNLAFMINFFPVVPTIGRGAQKIQPIYVQDVAQCIINAIINTDAPGKTYDLGGPEVMTKHELIQYLADDLRWENVTVFDMPAPVCRLYARIIETCFPQVWRTISSDMVDQMHTDFVVPRASLKCQDLGVDPVTLAKEASATLIRHRGMRDSKHSQFGEVKGQHTLDFDMMGTEAPAGPKL